MAELLGNQDFQPDFRQYDLERLKGLLADRTLKNREGLGSNSLTAVAAQWKANARIFYAGVPKVFLGDFDLDAAMLHHAHNVVGIETEMQTGRGAASE